MTRPLILHRKFSDYFIKQFTYSQTTRSPKPTWISQTGTEKIVYISRRSGVSALFPTTIIGFPESRNTFASWGSWVCALLWYQPDIKWIGSCANCDWSQIIRSISSSEFGTAPPVSTNQTTRSSRTRRNSDRASTAGRAPHDVCESGNSPGQFADIRATYYCNNWKCHENASISGQPDCTALSVLACQALS